MGDVMDKYSIDYYQILDSELYRLKEKDTGIYWYPLRDFFKKALFRKVNITSYRDNEFYNKYIKRNINRNWRNITRHKQWSIMRYIRNL